MITTAATLSIALVVTLGAVFVGQEALEEPAPAQQIDDRPFSEENPPGSDDYTNGVPVKISMCNWVQGIYGDDFENAESIPHPSNPDLSGSPGSFHIVRGRKSAADWEAAVPGYPVSDPRLSGRFTETRDFDDFPGGMVANVTTRVENEGGAWQGSYTTFTDWLHPQPVVLVLTGEGDYEGLTALLNWEIDAQGYRFPGPPCQELELWGIVVETPLPPVPDMSS